MRGRRIPRRVTPEYPGRIIPEYTGRTMENAAYADPGDACSDSFAWSGGISRLLFFCGMERRGEGIRIYRGAFRRTAPGHQRDLLDVCRDGRKRAFSDIFGRGGA